MSADPIDVVVRDRISPAVRDKLLNIAAAALEGANSVERLQKALEGINGSSVNKLIKAQSDLERQTAKNNIAYLNQETALNKAIAAETAAETAAEKLTRATLQSEAAQLRAAAAASKTAQASAQAAQATNAFGETEAAVAARLGAVSQAGAALAKQQQAITVTATQAVTAENSLARATTASGTAARTTAQRYTDYMSALNTLNRSSGGTSTGVASPSKINESTDALNRNGFATAGVTRELIVLGHEAISGNFSRIPGSLLVLTEQTGSFTRSLQLLTSFLTPLNVLIGLTVGLFVVYAKSLDDIDNAQRKLNNTMTLTGGIAGLTIDSFDAMSKSIANANNITISSSKELVGELAASGRFQANEIAQIADSAVKLGKLSNTAADEIVKAFIKAQDAPLQYAETLQKTTAAITPLQLDEIKRLDDLGQHAQAAKLLQQDLYEFLQNNAPQALGGLSGIWQTLKNDINSATTAVEHFIRASDQSTATNADRLGDLQTSVSVYTKLKDVITSIGANGLADIVGKRLAFKQGSLDGLQESISLLEQQAKSESDSAAAGKIASQAVGELGNAYSGSKGNVQKMNEELIKFRTNLDLALNNPKTKNAQTTLDALDNQAAIEASIRKKYAPSKTTSTPDENREAILAKITAALQKQLIATDQLNGVRETAQKLQEVEDKLSTHTKDGRLVPLKALNAEEKNTIAIYLEQIAIAKRVEAAQENIYTNVAGPLRTFTDGQQAITNLLKNHTITAEEAAQAQRALGFAYDAATNPLFQYNRAVKDSNDLLDAGLGIRERAARGAVQQINQNLAPQGKSLSAEQAASVERQNIALQKRNEFQSEYDKLVQANSGQAEQLVTQLNALNSAYANGVVSQDQYKNGFVQIGLAMNQLLLDKGQGFATLENVALGAIGRIVQGYKNGLSGLSDTFGTFFTGLTDGFANSIGRAIVYSENLGSALQDVAKQGVAELISSLIKLGIQYVINATLGTAVSTSALTATTIASSAAAGTIATAWAPAASLVSLATAGANAAGAAIGMSAIALLGQVIARTGSVFGGSNAGSSQSGSGIGGVGQSTPQAGFAAGGYTGNLGVNQVAGVVHGQEFVMDAVNTRRNRGALEAMRAGGTPSGTMQPKISIENYGTSKDFEIVPVSRDEVKIIARDEAAAVVKRDAPGIVAADMRSPNSRTSKAVQSNFEVSRNRSS